MNTTVIVPAYKAHWCLYRCLKSIAVQTILPDEVLIGIDSCEKTRTVAAKTIPKSIRGITRIFWFERHVGCYVIRNSLIDKARKGIIILFDSDDEMYPNHVATILENTEPNAIVRPLGDTYEEEEFIKVRHNHGIISCGKDIMEKLKGFEPWICAADTEFIERAERNGVKQKFMDKATVRVHKHPGSLTKDASTNLRSKLRRGLKAEIVRRRSHPVEKDTFDIEKCVQIYPMEN